MLKPYKPYLKNSKKKTVDHFCYKTLGKKKEMRKIGGQYLMFATPSTFLSAAFEHPQIDMHLAGGPASEKICCPPRIE